MASFIERHRIGLRLFTLVFLTLYAELALIRYASAQIRYLGYFSNFILIAVFLGIGLGFLLENKKITLFKLSPFIFLGWMAFVVLATPHVGILRHGFGQLYFGPDLEKISFLFGLACRSSLAAPHFSSAASPRKPHALFTTTALFLPTPSILVAPLRASPFSLCTVFQVDTLSPGLLLFTCSSSY